MIYDNLEFFNVKELSNIDGLNGKRINRFPQELISNFESPFPASYCRGTEIRFKMKGDSGSVKLYLTPYQMDATAHIFFGDFFVESKALLMGITTTLDISKPGMLTKQYDILNKKQRYSKDLVRVFLDGRSVVHYCGKDVYGADISLPEPNDAPKKSILFYGSSITHGAGAISHYNCYAQQVGRLLGTEVFNLGMSGSCKIEPKIADYYAENYKPDLVYLELGVNMRGEYDADEFEKRVRHILHGFNGKNIVLTTVYPNYASYEADTIANKYQNQYNDVLLKLSKEFSNIYLLNGDEILTDFTLLTFDLIHPSEQGHTEMAYNIVDKIKEWGLI